MDLPSESNLQSLCVKSIANDFDRYFRLFYERADERTQTCVRLLQKHYCNQILRIVSDKKLLRNEHLYFLINNYTKELDLRYVSNCEFNIIEERLQDVGNVITGFSMAGIKNHCLADNLLQHFSKLQIVDLSRTNCSDDSLATLLKNCNSDLQKIFLHGCKKITDVGLQSLCEAKPPLVSLNVEYTSVSHRGVARVLKELVSLTELWYDNVPRAISEACDPSDPNQNAPIFNLSNLVILNNPMRPENHLTDILQKCIHSCPCLRDLVVSEIVTEEQLHLCSRFPGLQNVSLLCSNIVSPKFFINSFLELRGDQITTLSLRSFSVSVDVLARHCPNLESLCLQYPTYQETTGDGVSFPCLVRLSLQNAFLDLEQNPSPAILITSSPKLEELHIIHCDMFEDMQEVLLKAKIRLRFLNLSNTEVPVYFVLEMLRTFGTIEHLVIDNSGITTEDYDDIMDMVDEMEKKVNVVWSDYSEAIRELFCMDYDFVFNNPQKRVILKL